MLGMVLPDDDDFLWIAEESLLAPLPEGGLKQYVLLYVCYMVALEEVVDISASHQAVC